jgi:hypothetical protein
VNIPSQILSLILAGVLLAACGTGSEARAEQRGAQFSAREHENQAKTILLTREAETFFQRTPHEFVRTIDASGSPAKGPEDAVVVMVVFSDFQ